MTELLTINEVAAMLRTTSQSLKRWEKEGRGLPCIRINTRGDRRYKKQDVLDYLEENTEKPNESMH